MSLAEQSLLFDRECYKQTFYGIQSHRCLQMTPSINQCNHMCLFCWRHQGFTEKEFKEPDTNAAVKAEKDKYQEVFDLRDNTNRKDSRNKLWENWKAVLSLPLVYSWLS